MKPPSLLKNILTYGIGQVLTRCLSLILLPFFTHILTVQDYGIISLLNFIVTFASAILTLGIGTAFGIGFSNPSFDKAKVMSTSFIMILITCSLFIATICPWLSEISSFLFSTNSYAEIIILTCLSATFLSLSTPFSLFLQFNHQATPITIISIACALILFILNIIFVAVLKMGVQGQAWATLIASFSLLLMYWIPVKSHFKWMPSWIIAKYLLNYGLPMIPASFALFFLQNNQRYFLDQYSSLTELGLYSVGFNIASIVLLFVSAFSQAWTPFFMEYSHKQNEAKQIFGNIFTYYSYFFGIVALAFFVFASPVVKLTTASPFHPSATIIGIIASGWIFIGYYNIMNVGIVFAKKIYLNSVIQFTVVFLTWITNVFTHSSYGMWEAALILFGSQLAMVLIEEGCNLYFGFFRIPIEWKRLSLFFTAIIFFISLTYLLPLTSLSAEIIWGSSALLLTSLWTYFNFSPSEKQYLRNLVKTPSTLIGTY